MFLPCSIRGSNYSVYSVCANFAGAALRIALGVSDIRLVELEKFFRRVTRYRAMIKKPIAQKRTGNHLQFRRAIWQISVWRHMPIAAHAVLALTDRGGLIMNAYRFAMLLTAGLLWTSAATAQDTYSPGGCMSCQGREYRLVYQTQVRAAASDLVSRRVRDGLRGPAARPVTGPSMRPSCASAATRSPSRSWRRPSARNASP